MTSPTCLAAANGQFSELFDIACGKSCNERVVLSLMCVAAFRLDAILTGIRRSGTPIDRLVEDVQHRSKSKLARRQVRRGHVEGGVAEFGVNQMPISS